MFVNLHFFSLLIISIFFFIHVKSQTCTTLPSTSLCSTILTNPIFMSNDNDQLAIEDNITNLMYLVDVVSPTCAPTIALLLCTMNYPLCTFSSPPTPNFPCQTFCYSVQNVCNVKDVNAIEIIMGSGWFVNTCNSLPSSDCYTPSDTSNLLTPPRPICAPYTGSFCTGFIDYPIYIRPNFNQTSAESWPIANKGYLGLVPTTCKAVLIRTLCSTMFPQCDSTLFSRTYNYSFTYQPVFPRVACNNVCQSYLTDCADLFIPLPKIKLNCSAIGCTNGWNLTLYRTGVNAVLGTPDPELKDLQCPLLNSSLEDFPMTSSIVAVLPGKILSTECNPLLNQTTTVESGCNYPLVYPDDPNYIGLVRDFYPNSPCELSCPATYLYTQTQWDRAQGIMYLSIPSCILTSWLLLTFVVFPNKRSQVYVTNFIFTTWLISLVLVFSFAATKGNLLRLGCKNNAAPHPMNEPSYCSFQGFMLFYLSLCQSFWWFVIVLDLFLAIVLDKARLTPHEKTRKNIIYSTFAYGVSLLLIVIFIGAGGRFGSDQSQFILLCWAYNQGSYLDYILWFTPIALVWVIGLCLMAKTLKQLHLVSSGVASTRPNWHRHIRPLTFILVFFIINFWFFFFRINQTLAWQEILHKAQRWFVCFVRLTGDTQECGDKPGSMSLSTWYGLHFAWSCQGIIVFLIWGTQQENLDLWKEAILKSKTVTSTRGSRSQKTKEKEHSMHSTTEENRPFRASHLHSSSIVPPSPFVSSAGDPSGGSLELADLTGSYARSTEEQLTPRMGENQPREAMDITPTKSHFHQNPNDSDGEGSPQHYIDTKMAMDPNQIHDKQWFTIPPSPLDSPYPESPKQAPQAPSTTVRRILQTDEESLRKNTQNSEESPRIIPHSEGDLRHHQSMDSAVSKETELLRRQSSADTAGTEGSQDPSPTSD